MPTRASLGCAIDDTMLYDKAAVIQTSFLLVYVRVCFKGIIASWISVPWKSIYYLLHFIMAVKNNRLAVTYTSRHDIVT